MGSEGTAAAIGVVAALDDPQRSRLYGVVRAARRPVTRAEAARAVDISPKLAAFHLDKLVKSGLLDIVAEPSAEPRGVGRAPKRYQPARDAVRVSIPARSFEELAAVLVAAAVTPAEPGDSPGKARCRAARARGQALGSSVERRELRGRLGPERALALVESVLAEEGFEPYRAGPRALRLANCPFHPLAQREPELVCGINVDYLGGVLDGLGADSLAAVLSPRPGECCVEIRAAR